MRVHFNNVTTDLWLMILKHSTAGVLSVYPSAPSEYVCSNSSYEFDVVLIKCECKRCTVL